ncbi:uncharacterized protein LOC126740443 [Anthonomus grandis grandis]|uniref:uncharacterized protein LOC126740443 n=1 Tax=Anthonomus grandis grandis TaxID=2921223 RepID=UPI002165E3BD|nr:uncharacterized protein LOC126740443 [Anthonomus grandis grandis]
MDIRYYVFLWCWLIAECNFQAPSGKIDFDGSTHSPDPNIQTVKTSKTVTACTSSGCNTTESNNSSLVNTEILVHVQTKVNLNRNQNKSEVSDSGEVPVLFGCNGERCSPDSSYYGFNKNGYRASEENRQHNLVPSWLASRPYGNSHDSQGFWETNFDHNAQDNSYDSRNPISFNPNSFPRPLPQPRPLDRPRLETNQEIHIPHFTHSNNHHHFNNEPPFLIVNSIKRRFQNPVEFRTGTTNQWRPTFEINQNHKYDFNEDNRNFINPNDNAGTFRHYQPPPINIFNRHENGLECICKKPHSDLESAGTNHVGVTRGGHGIKLNRQSSGFIDDKLAPLN